MDIISDVMETVNFSGNIFVHSNFLGDWGAYYQKQSLPVFHYLISGTAWIAAEGSREFTKLQSGDVAFLPTGIGHYVASSPGIECKEMTIVPDEMCAATEIDDHKADQTLMCGVFRTKDDFQHPLFSTLPDLMHVKFSALSEAEAIHHHVAHMIHQALNSGLAGTSIMIDRLYEILFIQLLQRYFSDNQSVDSFYLAPAMTRVGEVLKAIHREPAKNWTLDNMAEMAYMSRSAFTSNFRRCVGLSPMEYVIMWRMNKARSLVRNSGRSYHSIARKVGYQTQIGLNKAFKKHFGYTPKSLRK